MIRIILFYILILIVYLIVEYKNKFIPALILKTLVSFIVAVIAWISVLKNYNINSLLIAIGLFFAIPADFFLQYIKTNEKKYNIGIICFTIMHLFFIISFFTNYNFHIKEFLIMVLILIILEIVQTKQKWNLGNQKVILTIYSIFVSIMTAKAISLFSENHSLATGLLTLGGLSFIISDLILGIWRYYKDKQRLVIMNRLIYFTGQILFALSIYYI